MRGKAPHRGQARMPPGIAPKGAWPPPRKKSGFFQCFARPRHSRLLAAPSYNKITEMARRISSKCLIQSMPADEKSPHDLTTHAVLFSKARLFCDLYAFLERNHEIKIRSHVGCSPLDKRLRWHRNHMHPCLYRHTMRR